ncbi:hypothetical protein HOG17_04385 [Candidatus Peregrinibacteria bacterium]|nr:hypothetical protein [Candidatus Peregrinibacteria bacterium]MBT4148453.1 hypothetical protein [Candidatus Peregrinibacteria bacterium]MBT4366540.1 hypothetical protein [Candidatus Peregrinibacteria bacterium]MBT4456494.1 hypothetical protein [Candidatus Peregrinibacteria bacterium]
MSDLSKTLRTIYMYLVALVSVIVFIIGAVNLINTSLETWVFPTDGGSYYEDFSWQCDEEETVSRWETTEECLEYYEAQNAKRAVSNRNRDFAFGVSMTVVSLPIWLLHMWFIAKDRKKNA